MAAQAMALEPGTSRYRAAYISARDAARDAAGGGGGSAGRKTRHLVGEQPATEADEDDDLLSLVWVDGVELEQAVASAFGWHGSRSPHAHVFPLSLPLSSSIVLPSTLPFEAAHWDGTMGWQGEGQRHAEGCSGRDCDEGVTMGMQVGKQNEPGKRKGGGHGVPQVALSAAPALLQDEEDGERQAGGEEERSRGTGSDHGLAGRANDVSLEHDGMSDGIVFLDEGDEDVLDEVEEVREDVADGVSKGAPVAQCAARETAQGCKVQDVDVEGEDYYEMYVPPVHTE